MRHYAPAESLARTERVYDEGELAAAVFGMNVMHEAQTCGGVSAGGRNCAVEEHARSIFLLARKPAPEFFTIHGPVERVEISVHGRVHEPLLQMRQVPGGETFGVQGHFHGRRSFDRLSMRNHKGAAPAETEFSFEKPVTCFLDTDLRRCAYAMVKALSFACDRMKEKCLPDYCDFVILTTMAYVSRSFII